MAENCSDFNSRSLLLLKLLSQFYFVDKHYPVKNDRQLMDLKKVIEDYIQYFGDHLKNGEGMVWYGGRQVAKSMLALYIAESLMEKGFKVCYRPNLRFLDYCTNKIDFPVKKIFPELDVMDLLILDNTAEFSSSLKDDERLLLQKLLHVCQEEKIPIFFLTHLDKKSLTDYIGADNLNDLFDHHAAINFDWKK